MSFFFFFPIVITREGKILIAENVWFSSLLWEKKRNPASGKSTLTKCPGNNYWALRQDGGKKWTHGQ